LWFCAVSCVSAATSPWICLFSVGTALFLSLRAGTATLTDACTAHCLPTVIIASFVLLPIAVERALTPLWILAPTYNVVLYILTAPALACRARAATIADLSTALCHPVFIVAGLFRLPVASKRAWSVLAPSCIGMRGVKLSATLDLFAFAWAATLSDVCARYCNPLVIVASLMRFPVASQGARSILAPTCIIVIRHSPAFDLVTFAGAAAVTDQGTTHCIPVVIVASLFLHPVAIDRA